MHRCAQVCVQLVQYSVHMYGKFLNDLCQSLTCAIRTYLETSLEVVEKWKPLPLGLSQCAMAILFHCMFNTEQSYILMYTIPYVCTVYKLLILYQYTHTYDVMVRWLTINDDMSMVLINDSRSYS